MSRKVFSLDVVPDISTSAVGRAAHALGAKARAARPTYAGQNLSG